MLHLLSAAVLLMTGQIAATTLWLDVETRPLRPGRLQQERCRAQRFRPWLPPTGTIHVDTGNTSVYRLANQTQILPGSPRAIYTHPHRVIYTGLWWNSGFPTAAQMGGFNRVILHVYLTQHASMPGAADVALQWTRLNPTIRRIILDGYHARGIAVMFSVFGSEVAFAREVATFTLAYGFDGVDVDYEDLAAVRNLTALAWITAFHLELRTRLPNHLISHAPLSPWFTTLDDDMGYYRVFDKAYGQTVDFYNLQYYNQGTDYQDCASIVTTTPYSSCYPGTALAEIHKQGVPWSKLVLGKPLYHTEAYSGYMEPSMLARCYQQMKALGGENVMFWQWLDDQNPTRILATVTGQ